MSRYEEGIKLIEEGCGNGKDNVISLSTIAMGPNAEGKPSPCVREVDAHYEDGVFYVTTWAKSNKMQQIAQNKEVAFAGLLWGNPPETESAKILDVSLDPKNAELRIKLRKTFADWYDHANDEQNENCVILAIHITKCKIFKDHGAVRYKVRTL